MKNKKTKNNITSDEINMFKGIAIFCLYFFLAFLGFGFLPFSFLGVEIDSISSEIKQIYLYILECIIILITLIMFKDYFVKSFKDFTKNINEYFNKYIKYWFLILGITMISNLIIMIIAPGSSAKNQDLTIEYIKRMPFIMYIGAVIVAPLIEEIVFRLSLKNIFKNKYVFIIISGLLFGLAHIVLNYETPTDLLYLIPYSAPGMVFAYVLNKSDNIFVTIGLHAINNGIVMAIQIIALFLI